MKTIYCSLILFCAFAPLDSPAQKTSVKKLDFAWRVLENASEEGMGARTVFVITNYSTKPLPSSGWSLYFNSTRHIEARSGKLKVEQVNRELYRIVPGNNFEPILKGESVRTEWIIFGAGINSSDAPKGCYWVWDDKPDVGIAIKNISIVPPATHPGASPERDSFIKDSERIFRRNEAITQISEKSMVKIFPTPYAYEEGSGLFMITESTWIKTDSVFEDIGQYLAEELYFLTGKMPTVNPGSGDERSRINIRQSDTGSEAYTLRVNPAGIEITASSPSGVFYAVQSLKTLILPSALKSLQQFIAVPAVEVIDGPRFAHRALLLDVARNFQSKQQVKKVIDLMALYKLNVLHLHLSDDEGWRLEIAGLPELTEIGGKRGHNLDGKKYLSPAFGSGPGWNGSGSGYYSRQDFIDILQYAKLNFVTVIPEIESPAHAGAAIVSMNYRYHRKMDEGNEDEATEFLLQDPDDQSAYASRPGWTNNIMDPGLPSTYRFIEKVIDEVIAIYNDAKVPLSLIHIGGNDMPDSPWTTSPVAIALMKGDPEIRDNQDVRRYFIGRINRILRIKGLPLYGWQEIATRQRHQKNGQSVFPDPEFAHCNVFVDVHKKVSAKAPHDLAFRLANAGYKVVLAPSSEFGFHLPYEDVFDEPGNLFSGNTADSDKPFRFQPFAINEPVIDGRFSPEEGIALLNRTGLTDYGKRNIVGIKGLLWSQNLTSPDEMEYMLLPRLLALAQRAWSRDPIWEGATDPGRRVELYQEDWSHFVNVLGKRELPRLDYYHGGYRYRIPAPGLMVDRGTISANIQFPGLTLRYTTDGKEPTLKSALYYDPIPAAGIVKVRAFNSVGRGGRTSTWISPLTLPEDGPEDQDEGNAAYTHK